MAERTPEYQMDNPIQPYDEGPLERRGEVTYSNNIEDEGYELRFPRLRLLQGTSEPVRQGTERAGRYMVDNFGAFDDLLLIPLGRGLWRERRLDKLIDPERPVACYSNDAKKGQGDPGGSCTTCEYRDKGCALITSYIGYLPHLNIPVRWDLRGGGRYTAQDLNTLIKVKGFRNFAVKLGKREVEFEGNKFLSPTVELAEMPENLEIPELT